MKLIRRVKEAIIKISYLIILTLALAYLVSSYKIYKGEELIPNILGYYGFTITTGSMEPTIKSGSYLLCKKTNSDDIDKGDIITFVDENTVVTHRVIDIKEDMDKGITFITKGDANNISDEDLVDVDDLIGKYVMAIPLIGYIFKFFKNGNSIILVGILAVVYLFIIKIKENKSFNNKEENINEKNQWKSRYIDINTSMFYSWRNFKL